MYQLCGGADAYDLLSAAMWSSFDEERHSEIHITWDMDEGLDKDDVRELVEKFDDMGSDCTWRIDINCGEEEFQVFDTVFKGRPCLYSLVRDGKMLSYALTIPK